MPRITSLHPKASYILDSFFANIAKLTLTDFSQQQQLLKRTKGLFIDLDRLGAEAFAGIFKYDYFNNCIEKDRKKYQEVLMFLTACIIEKYSESDLLRYFLPHDLSQEENRPEYSVNNSRVGHWFQLIGYWLRQLFNKPIYKLNRESSSLADSVKQLKISLNKKCYIENSVDVDFRTHLSRVLIQLDKKIINSQLEDLASEGIIEREKIVAKREEKLSSQERLFSEKLKTLTASEECFRKKQQLFNDEKKDLYEKNKGLEKEKNELKETISGLKKQKSEEKKYKHDLEYENFQYVEVLEELVAKYRVSLSDLPSHIKDQFFRPKITTDNAITNSTDKDSQPKLYRAQSCASFFFEQQAKDNQSSLQTSESLGFLSK